MSLWSLLQPKTRILDPVLSSTNWSIRGISRVSSLYLSLASKKALAKGLCFIFSAVICEEGDMTAVRIPIDIWEKSVFNNKVSFSAADLFVLVRRDCDELCFGERLAADHLLDAANLHDVYPRLIFVKRIQHDLQRNANQCYYLSF